MFFVSHLGFRRRAAVRSAHVTQQTDEWETKQRRVWPMYEEAQISWDWPWHVNPEHYVMSEIYTNLQYNLEEEVIDKRYGSRDLYPVSHVTGEGINPRYVWSFRQRPMATFAPFLYGITKQTKTLWFLLYIC